MSKLNKPATPRTRGSGPLRTEITPSGKTHEGGSGYARSAETELFLRATTVFAGEGQYYEDATVADERTVTLVRTLASSDEGWAWTCGCFPWLRGPGNIRTNSILLAAEAVREHLKHGPSTGPLTHRQLINAVQQRGDEPCEMIAYWLQHYGRSIPISVKRGTADAVTRLWDEYAVLRYDKPDRAVRFADVIDLCHPKARVTTYMDVIMDEPVEVRQVSEWQNVLFRHLITERKGRITTLEGEPYVVPASLPRLRARWMLNGLSSSERHALARCAMEDPEGSDGRSLRLAMAGQWEWLRSWLGEK